MPVVVSGVVELKKALNKFAPDLKKEMDEQVREALKPIIADARSHVPANAPGGLTNWNDPGYLRKSRTDRERGFPSFDSRAVRRGLTYTLSTGRSNSRGFVSLYSLLNKSAAGAIIETAGRKNPGGDPKSQSNNPRAGARFISGMNGVGALRNYDNKGSQRTIGRLLFAAYDRNSGKALDAIMKSIDLTSKKFQQRSRTHNERASAYGNAA